MAGLDGAQIEITGGHFLETPFVIREFRHRLRVSHSIRRYLISDRGVSILTFAHGHRSNHRAQEN